MVTQLLKEFASEKIILLDRIKAKRLPFPLEGIVRLVDSKGHLRAVVLDEETWSNLLETLEYANPNFWERIESSRKSGRVSSKSIEKRLGLK